MPPWSPDGRLLASRDLHGILVETPRGRRVATLKHPFASYEWTPGRRSMTVAEPRPDGAFRLVEVPLSGGRPRSLSPPLPELQSFTWTPDRRAILYSVINGDDYEVRRYRIGASRSERVGAGAALEVSPDGRRLLVGHDGVLWSQRLGGGGRRPLLRGDEVGLLGSATWPPNSRWVAVTGRMPDGHTGFWLVRADGRVRHAVTNGQDVSIGSGLTWRSRR